MNLLEGVYGNIYNPKILIVGECWGQSEKKQGTSFVGKSGELLHRLMEEQGHKDNYLATNLVNQYASDVSRFFLPTKMGKEKFKGCYPTREFFTGLEQVNDLIRAFEPKLVIGLGNYPLWALTNENITIKSEKGKLLPTGIGDWRGSMLKTHVGKIPFLPTYHPASTFRNYAWRKMIRHDFGRIWMAEDRWEEPEYNFLVRPNFESVINNLNAILNMTEGGFVKLAVDIETRNGFIACLGMAWTKKDAMCIPLLSTAKGRKAGYWDADEEYFITEKLREVLAHPLVHIIGQNFAFDTQYISNQLFVTPKVGDDTMLKHHVCYPGGGDPIKGTGPQGLVQKSLNHLSSLYCTYHKYWKDEGKTWETSMPEEQLWSYNCKDCCVTYEVNDSLDDVVRHERLTSQYLFQLAQLNEIAIPMMLRGVKIDSSLRNLMRMDLLSAIAQFEEKINEYVPREISDNLVAKRTKNTAQWFKSPTQLNKLFYEELGIKPVYGKSGSRTTGKQALPIIANREPIIRPLIDTLGVYRSLGVFYNTFISAALDTDGRMRCSFNVAGTDTFRWASGANVFGSGTNLQNIPKGDKDSAREELIKTRGVTFPNVRKLFIPDTNYLIIDADLSGADAQVVAWETGEEKLKDALKSGVKIHSVVAEELYGTDEQPHYDMCKRRIHATNYGGSARTINITLAGLYGRDHTSLEREREFQEYWFDNYPGVARWHENVHDSLVKTGGVKNAFGNRIIFQDRIDSVFTQALAWVPQSTVALVCMRGALEIQRKFSFIELLLQVHDSIVFQIPQVYKKHLPEIKETLNNVTIPYEDPLRIPWGLGVSAKSWGEVDG